MLINSLAISNNSAVSPSIMNPILKTLTLINNLLKERFSTTSPIRASKNAANQCYNKNSTGTYGSNICSFSKESISTIRTYMQKLNPTLNKNSLTKTQRNKLFNRKLTKLHKSITKS